MSIIEKAAGRLGQRQEPTTTSPAPAVQEKLETPVQQTVQQTAPHAAMSTPVFEASTPPVSAAQEAVSSSRSADINLSRLKELGMVTPDGERTTIAEEFRLIKRPLIDRAIKERATGSTANHGNLIMVTSALPDEGKTFCAVNLAISIAMELDHTVLLIDADVAKPSIPSFLGLQTGAGLMDILLDRKLDLGDVMLKTNIKSLSVLPAGRNHPKATELLASQAMSNLLDEIANRYADRIVIFDSPPMLLTSESRVLAGQMGQIVMVVAAETTTQRAVKNALQQIGATNNVSLLYNKSRAFSGANYYGSYYG